jgi:hypothetical protein
MGLVDKALVDTLTAHMEEVAVLSVVHMGQRQAVPVAVAEVGIR